MTSKEIKIAYLEYESLEQLGAEDRALAEEAIKATALSYAPYSKFNVGAAIMYEDGAMVKGSNQENAAYPSGICAERTTLFYASSSRPDTAIKVIAIAAAQNGTLCAKPESPSGACRQVMAEYQNKGGRNMKVILVGSEKIWSFEKVDDILPFIFDSI